MKIQSKLVLLFVIISLLCVITSGMIFFIEGKNALTKRVRAQLESITVLKESQLEHFIKTGIKDIEEITELDLIQNYLTEFPRAATSTNKERRKEEIVELLSQKLNYMDFTEIFIISMNGVVEYSTDPKQIGKIIQRTTYFVQGKEKTFTQDFYYDIALQGLATIISSPVRDEKGDTIGVLAGRTEMRGISELMLERSGLGETGETYLVNKFNFVVSELKKEEGAVLTRTIYSEVVKDCLKGNWDFTYYNDYAGDEVLGFYKWIPQREVCLLAKIDQKEVLEMVNQFRDLILIVSGGIIAFVFMLGLFFSRGITGPIIELRNAVIKIGQGKSDTKIKVKSGNEIGELALAFTQMTADLRKSRAKLEEYSKGLEKQVANRTKELEGKVDELEKFNKLIVGRELKMVELKKEINELKKKIKKPK